MEKIGQCFHLKGLSPTDIKAEMDSTLGESAPSFTTVTYWAAEFKRGRTSCQEELSQGDYSRNSEKIHKMVLDDRRLKMHELADMVDISKSAVHRMLTENLDMRKLCARWVPRLLTMEQKQRPENVSTECLTKFHGKKT